MKRSERWYQGLSRFQKLRRVDKSTRARGTRAGGGGGEILMPREKLPASYFLRVLYYYYERKHFAGRIAHRRAAPPQTKTSLYEVPAVSRTSLLSADATRVDRWLAGCV